MAKGTQALSTIGRSALTATPLLLDLGLGLGGTATAVASMGGSLLASAGAFGSLALAAAPVVAGVGAVAAVGYGVYKAFTQSAVPAVDLYKSKTETVFNEATGRMERHVTKISEETKKEYQHFYEMSNNIRQASEGMYVGLYKDANEGHQAILKAVEQYKTDYVAKINQKKDETISKFNELYGNSTNLSAEMKAKIVKDAEETAEKTIKSAETRLTEITRLSEELKNASGTKAEELKRRIIQLTEEQDFETIKVVAKNKAEQEMLFNNLYSNVDGITKQHVSDMVIKLNELRDKSVNAAKENKDKQLEYAEEWRAQKEILNGRLTKDEEETYRKMKEAAVEGYEKATREAEKLRTDGIDRLRKEYEHLDSSLDWNTGKVKSWARQVAEKLGLITSTPLESKSATYTIQASVVGMGAVSQLFSSHYNGLDYVPYDGYRARLHRGERVLTAEENKEYSSGGKGGNINVNIDKVYNNTPNDARKIAQQLGYEIKKQRLGGGLA